ncbi:MAG: Zn-finger nucleic acid-binding protein [Granulosicoccus sp.]|jgi:Zn-finger nucleic acid-binding protein
MKKAEHPRDKNVIIDYCEHCEGTWLDGGELEAIQKESWPIAIYNLLKKL